MSATQASTTIERLSHTSPSERRTGVAIVVVVSSVMSDNAIPARLFSTLGPIPQDEVYSHASGDKRKMWQFGCCIAASLLHAEAVCSGHIHRRPTFRSINDWTVRKG